MLPVALVMTGVILGIVVGGMNWLSGDMRRAQADRWRSVAADAAHTGLAMTLAWAKSTIDRTRTTPAEWELADGSVLNPLQSMFDSQEFRSLTPMDVGNLPRLKADVGSRGFPTQPGDVIDANGAGEYVVGRYGDHIATIRVRLQPFRVSEGAPRQYRIGVAGRVRAYDARNTDAGPFRGTRLVADRVLIATVGKQVLSRYATLTDTDLVYNWVPGERVEGPIHINRGYVDAPDLLQPKGVTINRGRSLMHLQAPGVFIPVPAGMPDHPIFTDTVSMTINRKDTRFPDPADLTSLLLYNNTPIKADGYTADRSRAIFLSPDNQNQLGANLAGPVLMDTPVELPPNSRARLPSVLGLAEGADIEAALPGLKAEMPDGVHLITRGMVEGKSWKTYGTGDDRPAGGIYVRGTVEVMRMAVVGDRSYYVFQVGYVHGAWPRRVYIVTVNRATGLMRLDALKAGDRYDSTLLSQKLSDLASGGAPESNVEQFSVSGGNNGHIFHQFAAPLGPTDSPFNGIIFVDWSRHDPIRGDTAPKRALTGHILALGDPGKTGDTAGDHAWEAKRSFPDAQVANWPADMAKTPPEVICTEMTGIVTTPPRATRLTIIAAGDIFIQNHLVVKGVAAACKLEEGTKNLTRENVSAQASRDVLGLVSDKQIIVGITAPSVQDRSKSGLVITGAIAALGDPAYNRTENKILDVPLSNDSDEGRRFRFRGSFSTEGLMHVFAPSFGESYEVLWPSGPVQNPVPKAFRFKGKEDCFPDPDLTKVEWPYTPIYGVPQAPPAATPATEGPFGTYFFCGDPAKTPNIVKSRGKLTYFGSLVTKKRGAIGTGLYSYDKDNRYDQRLMTLAPPLFPNSVNLVVNVSTLDGLGLPPYNGPRADEAKFLER